MMKNKHEIERIEGGAETGAMVTLIIGVGVCVLLLIFVGVLGGQAFSLTEPSIAAISNTTIQGYIIDSIASGFKSLSTVGQYLPLVVLAVIISLIIALITSFAFIGPRTTSL